MSSSSGRCRTPNLARARFASAVAASGVNPGDVKKRQDAFGYGMPYPRVIPHSDGAGTIDRVGEGVPASRVGERVWCYGAQSYRPFGTAAEYVVVPAGQAVPLPDGVPFEQGACLGIPGITAHRGVHIAGPVAGRVVLVQGGAGSVGVCAVQLARRAGAHVIATVRSSEDEAVASRAGAHLVIRTAGVPAEEVVGRIRTLPPKGSPTSSRWRSTRTLRAMRQSWPRAAPLPPMQRASPRRRCRSGSSCSRTSGCSSWAAMTSRPRRKPPRPAT